MAKPFSLLFSGPKNKKTSNKMFNPVRSQQVYKKESCQDTK